MKSLDKLVRSGLLCAAWLLPAASIPAVEPLTFTAPAEQLEPMRAAAPAEARATPKQPRKLLLFSGAKGYWHSSIPIGALAIEEMGRRTGAFETFSTTDTAAFEPEFLKQFDAVHLNNVTGAWLTPALPDMATPAQRMAAFETEERLKASLLEFVRGGGGLSGQHAASDAFYGNWPEFGTLIGGFFDGHPWSLESTVDVRVLEPQSPVVQGTFPERFQIKDEIYQFKEPYSRTNLRELLALDKERMALKEGFNRTDEDFAISWIRNEGKGRVFYTSLGHREDIYWNAEAMQYLLNGIQFALGDLEADASPSEP